MLARLRPISTLAAGFAILLSANAASGQASRDTLPDQVVVLRAPAATRMTVKHIRGDEVAEIQIRRPPPQAFRTLREQRGPFVREVEHISLERDVLTLLFRLNTDGVRIRARRIRRPNAWTLTFTPDSTVPFPSPSQTIGYLPGLTKLPHRPVLFPAPPSDTPCAGQPDGEMLQVSSQVSFSTELELEERTSVIPDPVCRQWVISRVAIRALEVGRDLSPFDRWAFLFAVREDGWPLHREAFAQVSLVAAEVLSRLAYEPEAETLLAQSNRYRRRHAPFRAMALANHLSRQGKLNEAETLFRQLVVEGFDPWVVHRASLGRALNALSGGDVLGTLAHVERASRLIEKVETLPGDLWIVGAEAALARNELALARQHFERAARSRSSAEKGLGLLRLADLEIRAGRTKSALEGWRLAEAMGGHPCLSDHIHLRRVLSLEKDRGEIGRFLESTSRFSRCEAVRMESDFAEAMIHLERGEELDALAPVLRVISNGTSRWGPARPHRAMLTRIARRAVARRVRHRNPAELVAFFEENLERHAKALDPATRLSIGKAYLAVGAPMRGATELLDLLIGEPKVPFREELLLSLGEGFLAAGDDYRADLILRHLESKYLEGAQSWRRLRLVGRFEANRGRHARALNAFSSAKSKLPVGDRRAELALDSAKSLVALGRVPAAVDATVTAVRAQSLSNSALLPTAIRVLSECARACSRGTLGKATRAVTERLGTETFTPRLIARLARRGALDAAAGADAETPSAPSSLWSRLDALESRAQNRALRRKENP